MSKFKDIETAAVAKLVAVPQEVQTYVNALKDKVAYHKMALYGIVGVIVFVIVAVAWHKLHGHA